MNLEIEENFFNRFGVSDQQARLAVTGNPDAKFLMVKLFHELLLNDNFSEVSISMLLLRLIGVNNKPPGTEVRSYWIKAVDEYLHEHMNESVTLEDLSKVANIHPVTISRLFPQYFSCTVGEYKRKIKIEKSLHLFKSKEITLSEVAYQCGFFDQSHFIRIFKSLTGCLPRTYKNL